MMKYILIIFFMMYITLFAQPNVKPLPEHAGMTYEQIITMYPEYYTGTTWYGTIYYQNTALPGRLYYYFSRNRCYAMQYKFASEDSIIAREVYEQYLWYVTNGFNINGYLMRNWGENGIYLHHFWTGRPLGWGAVMFDGSRMHYTNLSWDGNYYLVWMSMFRGQTTAVTGGVPNTMPKTILQ